VILAIGQLTNVGFGSVGMLLAMSGHERFTVWAYVLALTATVISAALLIPHFQQVGAAIAVTIGLLLVNVATAIAVSSKLAIRPGIF
jgi:hypothetical protein